MGNCAQFAALSGDGLPREDRRDSVAVLLAANWTEEGKVQRGCPQITPTPNPAEKRV